MDHLLDTRICPGCNQAMEVERCHGMLEFLNTVDAYCDECAEKKNRELEREQLKATCRMRYNDLLRRGLVIEHFRDASFSKSDKAIEAMNPEGWEIARNWSRKENIYIHGQIGTGKTFMALAVLRKAFVAGLDVAETTARQFVKTTDLFKDSENLFNAWKHADVLLLDDIDKARWNLDRIDALWELMNARMSAGRRTIITGNLSLRDIALIMRERSGDSDTNTKNTSRADAAMDRLKPIKQIELLGKSLRK